ncbi:MAG: ATPase, partial [Microcystis aeruginosa]
MDIQTLLEWTDKQVLEKTGKHLDSLQESILQGIWEHQDYEEIAKDNQRSYDHIKKEAWKLWQLLSDVFQEDIKKSNVRSILENKASSTIY